MVSHGCFIAATLALTSAESMIGVITVRLSLPCDSNNVAVKVSALGESQLNHFICLGDLLGLSNAILNQEKAADFIDDEHPDKPLYVSKLGISQKICFDRLGNLSDLKSAISNHTKAVKLTDDEQTNMSFKS